MKKATGHRGSWFADVEGERLPCVHEHWKCGDRYRDRDARPGEGKWVNFIDAIGTGKKVILTKDKIPPHGPWQRAGYIAVWSVDDVSAGDGALCFRFVEKLDDLKR
jgi:hypothetical protein